MIVFTEHQIVIHASISKGKCLKKCIKYTKIIPTYIYNALYCVICITLHEAISQVLLNKILKYKKYK